ncbi:hypothetical protein AOLI_G00327080 [Acnodon oligacanthus]
MTVDFRKSPPALPALTILDRTVVAVESYKFLGTTITRWDRWDSNIRQELKCAKPVVSSVKRWTNEAKERLQDCMELTDWRVFEDATGSLDEYTDTVTSYISFCEDTCVPTRTRIKYNKDKPWFNARLKQLRRSKEAAYRSGDRALYNQARNTLNKEIRAAKKSYSNKLSSMVSTNEPSSVWKCLQNITSYKRTPPPPPPPPDNG